MKRIGILILALLPLLRLVSQETKKVQEPEYIGVVFSLDPSGALSPLERQPLNVKMKVKAMGYGGGEKSIVFNGSASPVRFKAGQDIRFVVRLDFPGIDPEGLIKLDALKVSKDQREIVIVKVGPMGTSSKSTNGESMVPLNAIKYGEQSFEFSPAGPLAPGEYAIGTKGGQDGFLFGIDPK
jgi:hypothetical protein